MKTAKDTSSTAVIVLGLGLLFAPLLMPQIQKFENDTVTNWTPTQDATMISVNEGRLLERVPDNPGGSPNQTIAIMSGHLWKAEGNETAVRELVEALKKIPAGKPVLMSDSAALMLIGSFMILGSAASYADVVELSAEERKKKAKTKEAQDAVPLKKSPSSWLRSLKYAALFVSIVGTCATCMLLISTCFCGTAAAPGHVDEELVQLGRKEVQALVPDSVVVLLVTAFAILALFIMRADVCEMEQELQKTPNRKVESDAPRRRCHSCGPAIVALAVWLACLVSLRHILPSEVIEQTTTAVSDVAHLLDGSWSAVRAALFDFMLEMFLGVCTVIGLAVMRTDIREMVEQLQNEAGPRNSIIMPTNAEKAKVA